MANKVKLELTWPGKEERFNPEPRILIEDTEKSYSLNVSNDKDGLFDDDKSVKPTFDNMLIHGDNLLALRALEQDYTGKVKCIYIDPPYNTGNAFEHYDDGLEHSIWLSLMRDRLEILRNLLSDDGVIFVQIDDMEQAYLKVLMDEIFGRNNYLNTISIKMKNIAGASGGGEDRRLKKNVEYILTYTKNYNNFKWVANAYNYTEISALVENYRINDISWKYTSVLVNAGDKEYIGSAVDGDGNEIKIYKRNNPEYSSVGQLVKKLGLSEKVIYEKYVNNIYTTAMPQSSIRPRVMDKVSSLGIKDFDLISIEYTPKTGKNKGVVYEQFYKGDKFRLFTWLKDVVDIKDGEVYKKDLQGTSWEGVNLNNLTKEGDVEFPNGKKPEALIQRILEMSTNPDDLVLDSFLGSGTTAAVAHKMGRRWIGIEMGDHVYSHCIPRLTKVINGEDMGGITKAVNWKKGGGFKFYELASSLIIKDKFNMDIIDPKYNADMLAEAMCKIMGYHYAPDKVKYYKQGYSSEHSFIFTTTTSLQEEVLDGLSKELGNSSLLICCGAFMGSVKSHPNITIKKIPAAILKKCEWGRADYALKISDYTPEDIEDFEDVE